jgi:hypothetical protein
MRRKGRRAQKLKRRRENKLSLTPASAKGIYTTRKGPIQLPRKGHLRIAQRFSVGDRDWRALSPEGTAEIKGLFSRPFGTVGLWAFIPNAKALGYSQVCLRHSTPCAVLELCRYPGFSGVLMRSLSSPANTAPTSGRAGGSRLRQRWSARWLRRSRRRFPCRDKPAGSASPAPRAWPGALRRH